MHGRGKMGTTPASNAVTCKRHRCLHIGAASNFFFLKRIHSDSASIRADLAPIRADSALLALNRADSTRIRSYRSISAGGWNWPKQAKIGLELCRNNRNWLWMRPKHPKSVLPQFYFEYLLLLLYFLFCFVFLAFFFFFSFIFFEPRTYNVFFKNILIVKIYRKYKQKYF